jgi:hypothetical protein
MSRDRVSVRISSIPWDRHRTRWIPAGEICRLRTQQCLDGAALVHGLIALGGLIKRQLKVEDPARVDRPVPDQVDSRPALARPPGLKRPCTPPACRAMRFAGITRQRVTLGLRSSGSVPHSAYIPGLATSGGFSRHAAAQPQRPVERDVG